MCVWKHLHIFKTSWYHTCFILHNMFFPDLCFNPITSDFGRLKIYGDRPLGPSLGWFWNRILGIGFFDDMDFIETMVTQKSIQKSMQSQLADLCFPLKWPFADSIFRQTHMSIDFLNLKQGHARNLIQSFDMIRSWTKNCQWENHGIWRDPIELRNDIWTIYV